MNNCINIRLTRTNGTPVVVNAAMLTGLFETPHGKGTSSCLRTVDGNEWLVRETIDHIEAAIDAAVNGKPAPKPAAMTVETKAKAKK